MIVKKVLIIVLLFILIGACCQNKKEAIEVNKKQNEEEFTSVILKHFSAVENKDLEALKLTMSPKGNMELIQPGIEIINSVDGFLEFHKNFFSIPNWTIKFKLISKNVGTRIGVVTSEVIYKEPERNGKPYSNKLVVTYTLEKIENVWYIIKDHASSIEKK